MDLLVNKKDATPVLLDPRALGSILYHDIFDYPLSFSELIKWERAPGKGQVKIIVQIKNGFYFLQGRDGIILKRLMRKRISAKKLSIARKASQILATIPMVKFVGITGALAMENADDDSDIDLLIITQKGTLWTSRILVLLALKAIGFPVRRYQDKDQKDKLCLNMWLDETALAWPKKDRNIYTAHEIAQIVPLVNKAKAYERFIFANKWAKRFWPNAIKVQTIKMNPENSSKLLSSLVEPLARKLQMWYMRGKITREVVGIKRAVFHPFDWGKLVLSKLTS
ncbi:MAG TPA: hypothetical protein VJ481_02250 [Patescibacteria group bacterium]|uniref:Polymerase nucleotidyl transferase domain-containing protein n=1 Tax=Candidatus Woesebacteria bacterium RBG_13_46_13 TaxID=1802479 RepID=A0A1F7X514_9BACT|nr:MAG: hypothetical protein A2Y68_01995 [Candidatus Woesebacteria bacterium RBG_13_46_13]HJX59355.1 hypothetical protein [Patescibacteria group bacterium]